MGKKKVENIFNNISVKYDITNSIISLGIEKYWRFRFNSLINEKEKTILDACCGTGTSSFEIWKKTDRKALI
ncbi:MAG: class I SAM-dependent methyltransferase, partial [Candidatus Humimicrobiaceae bacterium]